MSKVLQFTAWSELDFKMNTKLAVSRMQLKRNKLFESIRQQRSTIESLLVEGQLRIARAKTIGLVKDERMTEALSMATLYCETLSARSSLINMSRTCPADLQTAVCSILFSAHAINVAEVINTRKLLLLQFGKQIICHCADLDCVHPKMKENLAPGPPSEKILTYYLTSMAQKKGITYEPPPQKEEPIAVSIGRGTVQSPHNLVQYTSEQNSSNSSNYNPTMLPRKKEEKPKDELSERFSKLLGSTDLLQFEENPLSSLPASPTELSEDSLIDSLPSPSFADFGDSFQEEHSLSYSNLTPQKQSKASLHPGYLNVDGSTDSRKVDVSSSNIDSSINLSKKEEHITNSNIAQISKNIVIAIGSGVTHAGFLAEDTPRLSIPTVMGVPKSDKIIQDNSDSKDEKYFGEQAIQHKGILKFIHPIYDRAIQDWEVISELWKYIIQHLQIDSSSSTFLICIPEYMTRYDQDQITRTFLNQFYCNDISIVKDPISILSVYEKTTGLIIDCGASHTRIVPIFNSQIIDSCCHEYFFGGNDVDSFLARLLGDSGYSFTSSSEMHILKQIKEKLAFVCKDPQNQENITPYEYTLPDGQIISLSNELYQCTEPFFNPSIMGIEGRGLSYEILNTIKICPLESRRELLCNVILVGGCSKLANFVERLGKELSSLTPRGTIIKISARPDRDILAWIGTSKY